MGDTEKDIVHLVRLALEGKADDVAALSRRILRAVARRRPDLVPVIEGILEPAASPIRAVPQPLPVDLDSRLELLRREPVPELPVEPTWPAAVGAELDAVVQEREREEQLADAGIAPTRSLLFTGAPGVGKTLAARWLAVRTKRPLLTLDLAAVMSSFLGRTGNNIRVVLDFARRVPSVLLLDEFDAIAKRRDDVTEVGELKRLVTVLLQAVDDWPTTGLLVAATNHPEMLDPAVWRRFDRVVQFPGPSVAEISASVDRLLGDEVVAKERCNLLATLLFGRSFADVARIVMAARRSAIVQQVPLAETLERVIGDLAENADQGTKLRIAAEFRAAGRSDRDIANLTGLARDTMRKHLGGAKGGKGAKSGTNRKEARS